MAVGCYRQRAGAHRACGGAGTMRRGPLALGPGGEFDRLRAIFARLGAAARDLGDDAALVRLGGTTLAVSIDLSLEGVHFRTAWLSFEDIGWRADRKSTRLNSSHLVISYAVFCLKK